MHLVIFILNLDLKAKVKKKKGYAFTILRRVTYILLYGPGKSKVDCGG